VDPKWWYRLGLAAVVVAFVFAIARMTMMAFSPAGLHRDRAEAAAEGRSPAPAEKR
jgi:hypothetical protein